MALLWPSCADAGAAANSAATDAAATIRLII
jgi:hypothetical protein